MTLLAHFLVMPKLMCPRWLLDALLSFVSTRLTIGFAATTHTVFAL